MRLEKECIELDSRLAGALRLGILTDLHIGSPFNGLDKLEKIVIEMNASESDVVLLLGDFVIHGVTGGSFVPPEQIAAQLGRLRARYGVFGVLGNHDVWFDAARVRRALESAGVRLLEDRAARLETDAGPLWLVGVSDYWTQPHNVKAAMSDVTDRESPVIAFTHNPDVFPEMPDRVNLTVAGHTHGGQVRLPLIGAPIVPSEFGQRFAAGHIVEQGRRLYVATGVGTSILPIRFRVPPAITVLTVSRRCGA